MLRAPVFFVICAVGLPGTLFAQHSLPPATEAPAGFDTPTLVKNPGSGSTSDGIIEPPAISSASINRVMRPSTI
jgi:hypothetical protein